MKSLDKRSSGVQADLDLILEEKPEGMTDRQWMSLEKKGCSMIRGCLADVVLYLVLEERISKSLWLKLHTMYMKKNICNKLMLKKRRIAFKCRKVEISWVTSRNLIRCAMSC